MEPPQNIRLLKAIVIGLGVLLMIALTVVVATIVSRTSRMVATAAAPSSAPATTVTTEIANEAPASFGTRKLDLPQGSRLIEIRPDGDRLVLRVRQVGGNEQLIVISLVSGERLGVIDLGAGAATGPSPAVSQSQD